MCIRDRLTRPQRIALAALTEIIPDGEDHALIADWRNAALNAGMTQSESKTGRYSAFTRASEALADAGKVRIDGPRCYPTDSSTHSTHSTQTVRKSEFAYSGSGGSHSTHSTHTSIEVRNLRTAYTQPQTGEADEDLGIPDFGGDEHPDVEAQPSTDGQ